MRTIIFLPIFILLLIANACNPRVRKATVEPANLNQRIPDANGHPDLYGQSTEEGMKQAPFDAWYLPNYNGYSPDSGVLTPLRAGLRNKKIQIFMGTWCGDSKREVPRMLKVLHLCGLPPSRIEIINVGHGEQDYKQSPTHEERGKDIHHIPTFIVYQDGMEINRIIETPIQSLEKDLLRIVNHEAYIPKYPAAAWMLQWYSHPDWEDHEHDSTNLASELKALVLHRGELDGLGRVQLSCHEISKALFTLRLNTILFPKEPHTLRSLSKALLRKGDTATANQYLEKADWYARQ